MTARIIPFPAHLARPPLVATLIEQARSGHQWHNAVLQLTAHWVARGWSNAEIITQAEGLTLPGYTVESTRAELRKLIGFARRKWAMPSPAESGSQ